MKNADYWKQRFEQLETAQHHMAEQTLADIARIYRDAQKELEGDIAAWYARFASGSGLTSAEARRMLTGRELEEFQWDVREYIRRGQENAVSGQWAKQLENASCRFHISRLEALKVRVQNSLEELCAKYDRTLSSALRRTFESGYYHTAFDLQKGFGIGWDIASLNQREVEKVLAKPWAADGYNFSQRIWRNKEKLISTIHTELSRNIALGQDPQKAIDRIAKIMETGKSNAGRLVMTESAWFSSAAQGQAYHDLGVEQYEILATLDSRTSQICRDMDGKRFAMKDFQAGVTAPPFHVRCRSTTIPYDPDFGEDTGQRAAWGEDGKTYYVPANMTYREWEKTFVGGGKKSGLTEAGIEAMEDKNELTGSPKEAIIAKRTAATVKEAEKAASQYANQITLKGVSNVDSLNEMVDTLEHLYQKYPQLKQLDEITVKISKTDRKLASAHFRGLYPRAKFMNDPVAETAICFGDGWKLPLEKNLKSWETYVDSLIKNNGSKAEIAKGRKKAQLLQEALRYSRHNVIYAGREVQSVITHELGHVLADQICGQLNRQKANPAFSFNADNPLWKKCQLIDTVYQKAISTGDIYSVSMYGASSSKEFFAECFAIHDIGVEELPDYIKEMIREVLAP